MHLYVAQKQKKHVPKQWCAQALWGAGGHEEGRCFMRGVRIQGHLG